MSKGKKNQQKGIKLSDAILQYNVKNYTGALTRVKAAQLKPGEEQKAKNLQYAITLRLAFAEIAAHNYAKAIQVLQPLLPNDPIAACFAGISYLYLSEYALAVPLLKNGVKTYPSFAFYHLLGEIYQQKDIDFKGFTQFFQTEWNQCSESQKQYLQIFICVFNNQMEEAVALVESLKNQSHFQHLNFEAFKSIFNPTLHSGSTESLSEKVKPLYRLLLNGSMTESEIAYFKNIDKETGELSSLLGSQNSLSASLQKEVAAQYNEQKVLDEYTLSQIMQAVPTEHRPYIAYNQAVNALAQREFEIADRGMKHVIVKYADDFVLVPESLSLYLNFYQNDEFKIYPNTFWAFVKKWLSVRNDNISVENLDNMGWLIFDIVTKHPPLIELPHSYELVKFAKDYPSVFAFKFMLILFPSFQVAPKSVKDSRLDLFSLVNAEKSKTQMVDTFEVFMSILSPYSHKFSFLDNGRGLSKSQFNQQIVYFGDCFIEAVTTFSIPSQNLIALEAFKVIHKYVKIIIDHNASPLPTGFYERFMDTYRQLLTKFPQSEALEIYKSDIQSAEYSKYLVKLKELTRYITSTTNFLAFLRTLPKTSDYTFIWEHFGSRIDETHFSDSIAECLSNFIEALCIYQNNEMASKNEIDRFLKIYKKEADSVNCEHPTTFYGLLIKSIVKMKALTDNTIYYFCIQYIEELTLNHKFEAKQYNAVADFLNWIKASGYYTSNFYDKSLIQKLKNYLIEVNKVKNLKGLETTIRNFASFN
jgi:hypothetical protein